jgi:glycosyltransferase involved in cell wall biosynthesis
VVARRLHLAGLAEGVESVLVTRFGARTDKIPGHQTLQDATLRYALRKRADHPAVYRFAKLVQRWRAHPNLANRPGGLEIFTPRNDRPRYADCTERFDPDVIHLHWISNFLDHEQFFRGNLRKKFVWTLHDMNPFTGGCHHAMSCQNYATDCRQCPQLAGTIDPDYAAEVLGSKASALRHLADNQLVITAPSKWLLRLSASSKIMQRFRHVHIENPAWETSDTRNIGLLRSELGLPSDKKVVLFVSDNLRNPRKGVAVLFEAAHQLARRDDVHFVGLGRRADLPRGLSVSFPGFVSDEGTLRRYFSAADAFVLASPAENSPLVIIEALTCGTPVVAFPVGGIPELVDDSNGVLARDRTSISLAEALHTALFERDFQRSKITANSAKYAPSAVMQKYRAVYRELAAT